MRSGHMLAGVYRTRRLGWERVRSKTGSAPTVFASSSTLHSFLTSAARISKSFKSFAICAMLNCTHYHQRSAVLNYGGNGGADDPTAKKIRWSVSNGGSTANISSLAAAYISVLAFISSMGGALANARMESSVAAISTDRSD